MEIREKLEKIGINYDNLTGEKIQIYNLIYNLAQKELLRKLGFALDKINVDKKAWQTIKSWRDNELESLK